MKKILIATAIILVIGVTAAGASGVNVVDVVWGQITSTIKGNTDAKVTNINQDIQTKVGSLLNDVKNAQTQRANAEIEKYYNEQIAALGTNPDLNASLNELQQKTTVLIAEEKARIDAAIKAALGK